MTRKVIWMTLLLTIMLTLTACGGDGEAIEEPTATPLPPQILELKDKFMNNIKDKNSMYITCEISLEAVSEEDLATLSESVPRIRDIVNGIFRSKSHEDLTQENALEMIRNEISEQIKAAFGLEDLKGVYIESYLISG